MYGVSFVHAHPLYYITPRPSNERNYGEAATYRITDRAIKLVSVYLCIGKKHIFREPTMAEGA